MPRRLEEILDEFSTGGGATNIRIKDGRWA